MLQLTGDLTWADDKVPVMQQNCVDDIILNREYTDEELNDTDTEAIMNETRRILQNELMLHICRPFDCSGYGRCVNGTCVCDASKYVILLLFLTILYTVGIFHYCQNEVHQ